MTNNQFVFINSLLKVGDLLYWCTQRGLLLNHKRIIMKVFFRHMEFEVLILRERFISINVSTFCMDYMKVYFLMCHLWFFLPVSCMSFAYLTKVTLRRWSWHYRNRLGMAWECLTVMKQRNRVSWAVLTAISLQADMEMPVPSICLRA